MDSSRRHFLKNAAAVTAGFAGLHTFIGCTDAGPDSDLIAKGYGRLLPDPDGVLDLPAGFSYRIVSRGGDLMDDGLRVPRVPDGMAAFPGPDGLTIVVRNHEVEPAAMPAWGPFGESNELLPKIDPSLLYDAGGTASPCLGGTTTFVFDTRTGELRNQFLSLAGTLRNCAGGPTPWNSWISCEESTLLAGRELAQNHGYPFEVPAAAQPGLTPPVALKAMGRFNHEAVAVHPESGIVYQTEDRGDGLIYRYIPITPGKLSEGGRLQALGVSQRPSLDTRNWNRPTVKPGAPMAVRWYDLQEIDSPGDNLRYQGFDKGAARFARGEGMWYGNGAIYFACTDGGRKQHGQIWRYTPSPREGSRNEQSSPGQLEIFLESTHSDLLENADNLTVAPWGDLIVCEDGPGEQRLVGVTTEGRFYTLARNAVSDSEFAGVTFSPDGSTLFVNLQYDRLTLAITGDWKGSKV